MKRVQDANGAATAEFVLLLPAVIGLMLFGIGLVTVQIQTLIVTQQVGQLGRLLEAGRTQDQLQTKAATLGLNLKFSFQPDGLTCLTANRNYRMPGQGAFLPAIPVSAGICGLAPGY